MCRKMPLLGPCCAWAWLSDVGQRTFRILLPSTSMKSPAIILLAAALGGCAQVYVPPPSESRAYLRLSPSVHVFSYFDNGEDCTGLRRFNDADNPFKRSDRTLEIPSGRRIGVNLVITSGLSACNVTFTFVPQPGRRYDAQIDLSGDRCFARIIEPGRPPSTTVTETVLRQVRPGLGTCAGQ